MSLQHLLPSSSSTEQQRLPSSMRNICNAAHRGADGSECDEAAGRLGARPPRAARRLLLGTPAHAAAGGAAARRHAIIHLRATRLIWSSCSALRQQPGAGAGAQEASVAGGNCAAREEGQRHASVEPVPCLLPGLPVDVALVMWCRLTSFWPPGPGSLRHLAAELRPECRFCSF